MRATRCRGWDWREFFAPGGAPEDHWTAFAGITVIVLAIVALIYRWSDRRVRMLGFLALGSLIYALGANTPLHRLAYAFLPLVEKARSPGRGIFLAGFALSALAAVGADLVIRGLISRKCDFDSGGCCVGDAGCLLVGAGAGDGVPGPISLCGEGLDRGVRARRF